MRNFIPSKKKKVRATTISVNFIELSKIKTTKYKDIKKKSMKFNLKKV